MSRILRRLFCLGWISLGLAGVAPADSSGQEGYPLAYAELLSAYTEAVDAGYALVETAMQEAMDDLSNNRIPLLGR